MARHLLDALVPVLRDVHASGLPVSLHVRKDEVEQPAPGVERAMLWASDGSGTGVQIDRSQSRAEQVAALASGVQDLVIEDFVHAPWPRCPLHPLGGHPLVAGIRDDRAVWACPVDDVRTAIIGEVQAAVPPGRRDQV